MAGVMNHASVSRSFSFVGRALLLFLGLSAGCYSQASSVLDFDASHNHRVTNDGFSNSAPASMPPQFSFAARIDTFGLFGGIVGDFNGDGISDVATGVSGSLSVSVF